MGKDHTSIQKKTADINNLGDEWEDNIFPICYEGAWENDCFNGRGIMYYTHGYRYEGYWKDDAPYGEGNYYYKDTIVTKR